MALTSGNSFNPKGIGRDAEHGKEPAIKHGDWKEAELEFLDT